MQSRPDRGFLDALPLRPRRHISWNRAESLVQNGQSGRFLNRVNNPTTAPDGGLLTTGVRRDASDIPVGNVPVMRTKASRLGRPGPGMDSRRRSGSLENEGETPETPRRVEAMVLPRMRSPRGSTRRRVALWSALAIGTILPSVGCQVEYAGMTLPSGRYMHDDVQYFPSGPDFPWANSQAATQRARMRAMGIEPPPEVGSAPVGAGSLDPTQGQLGTGGRTPNVNVQPEIVPGGVPGALPPGAPVPGAGVPQPGVPAPPPAGEVPPPGGANPQ